jgi:hypothetical protein
MPRENKRFDAQFSVNSYTLTFYSDNTVYDTITQDYGTSVTAPEDPVKQGYSFTGWSPSVPATMPAENRRFDAQYSNLEWFIVNNVRYDIVSGTTKVTARGTGSYTGALTIPATITYQGVTYTV